MAELRSKYKRISYWPLERQPHRLKPTAKGQKLTANITMRNFRKFQIWKKGIQLSKEIYQVTSSFPEKEKFGLISQLRRAAISIPSNIAEGCSRSSEKEFKRFLEIALGSAFELETQLIISLELSYLSQEHYGSLIEELTILQKQLNALIGKIGR